MKVARFCSLFVSLAVVSLAAGTSAEAKPRSSAVLKHGPPAFLIGHSDFLNWAGYSSYNGTFTDVKGTWTQPAATCTKKATYSSFFVGLDGYNSDTVEQVGTEADCSHGGGVYYAWWELYPNPSHSIRGFSVTPGKTYSAEVKSNGNGSFTLTLSGGGNAPFSTTQTLSNPSLSSAEWVAEAPSMCTRTCRILPLTNFGTVGFSGSSANNRAINDTRWSFDPMRMVTNRLQVKAFPSDLYSSGSAFSVTWAHS